MSTSKRVVQMTKPTPDRAEKALSFAEKAAAASAPAPALSTPAAAAPAEKKPAVSGRVPENDVRLTANIDKEIHRLLKIVTAMKATTIGEYIESVVLKDAADLGLNVPTER